MLTGVFDWLFRGLERMASLPNWRIILLIGVGSGFDAFSTWIFMSTPGMGPGLEQNLWLKSTVFQTGSIGLLPFQFAQGEFTSYVGMFFLLKGLARFVRTRYQILVHFIAAYLSCIPIVAAIGNLIGVFVFLQFGILWR